MAHAAKLSALAEGLISSIITLDSEQNPSDFRKYQDLTLKGLRANPSVRVNQFEVKAHLEGLVEKFAIVNQDLLSDALQDRLNELWTQHAKWTPEILSLLFSLSDRPLESARVDELAGLKATSPPPELTWADIIRDDPLEDDEIWNDVAHEAHSSADEAEIDALESEETALAVAMLLDDSDLASLARCQVKVPNPTNLNDIEYSQTQLTSAIETRNWTTIDELWTVRESLSMLHGLPTALYTIKKPATVEARKHFGMSMSSVSTISDVLRQFSKLGTSLNRLRQHTRSMQQQSFKQTFQSSVQHMLSKLSSQLADIEQRYIVPSKDIIVSIIDVLAEVQNLARTVVNVSVIIDSVDIAAEEVSPFALLDSLYDHTCTAQLSGETEIFEGLNVLLLACVSTWLRPVAYWMDEGVLEDRDGTFFSQEAKARAQLGSLWHDRYNIRTLANGSSCAPQFAHALVNAAFLTGKSIVFLRTLGDDSTVNNIPKAIQPHLRWSELKEELATHPLLPFSELFQRALSLWARRADSSPLTTLRTKLLEEHGLRRMLDAHEYIYFSRDGALFQQFADTLFQRMDMGCGNWRDRFLLTELAQTAFGSLSCVESDNLSVRLDNASKTRGHNSSDLGVFQDLIVEYHIAWPLQNITRESLARVHQRALVFLLQVYRARCLLKNFVFDIRQPHSRARRSNHASALALHQRLFWFVDIIQAYFIGTAATTALAMLSLLEGAEDIDAMCAIYAEYRALLETRLILTANLRPIQQAITSVLDLCVGLSQIWAQLHVDTGAIKSRPTVQWSSSHEHFEDDQYFNNAEDMEPKLGKPVTESLANAHSIGDLSDEFDRNIRFIVAGLRSVSRAGGEMAWETLAQRLEWEGRRRS